MTSNQRFGCAFGGFFVLVGILGFITLAHGGPPSMSGDEHPLVLGLFSPCPFFLSPLHSLIHLAGGIVLLVGATRGDWAASRLNKLGSATYLLLGLAGFVRVALGADVAMHHTFVYLAIGVVAVAGATRASVVTPSRLSSTPSRLRPVSGLPIGLPTSTWRPGPTGPASAQATGRERRPILE